MHNNWNPFEQMESLFERMQTDMNSGMPTAMNPSAINVDVMDDGDAVTVVADIPGVEKADLELSYRDAVLTIAADTTSGTDENDAYLVRERRHTRFERRISLPAHVDHSEATATYVNGVLTVTLPKVEDEDDSTHIEIE